MILQGKVALVTGGGRGIGEAIAIAFAREGADVAVTARTQTQIDSVADRIRNIGRRTVSVAADVSNPIDVQGVVDCVHKELGQIDILINNAGINIPARVVEAKIEDFDRILSTNLRGTFLFTRTVLPEMINRGRGAIVNISSEAGTRGHARNSVYCASKFGIVGFTQAVADEVKDLGITVNVICPDEVDTPLNRRNHPNITEYSQWTSVDEIADAVLFLVSEASRAIRGASIEVYGHSKH